MECVDNKMRKKIRKTRKTLNEIRKRTNRFQNVSPIINSKTYNNKNHCNIKAPVYITTNRLTLFNKTIRSETIARPAYTSQANTNNKMEGVKDIVLHKMYETREKKKEEKFECKSDGDALLILSTSNKETNWDKASSLDLLSALHHINNDKCPRDSNPTCESPPVLHLQSVHNMYEQFTNSISEYLSKEVPQLLNMDIMEKAKSTLRHMYLESDEFTGTCRLISRNATEHTDSFTEVSSPEMGRSSHSLLSSTLCDSPEYCYYPHRLKQSQ